MDEQDRYLRVIEDLYSSIMDEHRWSDALNGIVDHLGGNAGFLMTFSPRGSTAFDARALRVDPECLEVFRTHFGLTDPRAAAAANREVGTALLDHKLVNFD